MAGEPMKVATKRVARAAVDLGRCAGLLDPALVHHHHGVGERHRLHLIVGDEDRGGLEAVVQAADLDPHLHAQLGVEVRQRLVEQEGLRLAHDGAAHGDALALAAGELARLPLEKGVDAQQLGGIPHARLDLGLGNAAVLQAVGHVVVDVHMRIERVVLEHHGDVAVGRLHVVDDTPADRDGAAGDGLEAGDHPEQGGLAAARRPEQHRERAVGNTERHALHGLDAAGVDLAHILQRHRGHVVLPPVVCARTLPLTGRVVRRALRAPSRVG